MTFTTLISSEQLAGYLDDSAWVLIDCRFSLADPGAGERAYRAGHIPTARYAHLERDLSAPTTACSGRHPLPQRETLIAALGAWGVGHDSQVVAYDDAGGAFAARLWWLLRSVGQQRVAVLDGGWGRWLQEGRPVTDVEPVPQQALFRARPPLAAWLSTAQLQVGLAQQAFCLVDARAAERFRGEVEPIDTVAGHVPGAVNLPFQHNLAADGRFLSPDQLRRQFMPLLGRFRPEETVHMCGSGVTACHNLLAMEVAGLSGSRLYPGSWSEWIRDPARPVVRGASS